MFSSYQTTITSIGSNRYDVVTLVRDHFYDVSVNELTGVAPSRTLNYHYTLTTDSSGHVISGSWINMNPDFLWVPLSGARCSNENPYVTDAMMDAIGKLSIPQTR